MYTYIVSINFNLAVMTYLFKLGTSLLLLLGAWGCGYSAGMIAKAYGFGNKFIWILALIFFLAILAADVYWYIKQTSTEGDKTEIRNQGQLYSTMTGISVIVFFILNSSKSFHYLFAGWDVHLRLKSQVDWMVFFVSFTLVAAIISIIAWVNYNKPVPVRPRTPAPTTPTAPTAGGTRPTP